MYIIPKELSLETVTMQELGLEFNDDILVDQDTRETLLMDHKYIVKKENSRRFNEIPHIKFEPSNTKLMQFLFSYYSIKLMREDDIYIDVIYYKTSKDSHKSPLAVQANNKEYVSRIYNMESLKYLDIILQLNGADSVDLSRFDITYDT